MWEVNQGTKSEPSDMSVFFCEGNNTVGAENTQLQRGKDLRAGVFQVLWALCEFWEIWKLDSYG